MKLDKISSWQPLFEVESKKEYFSTLMRQLDDEYKQNKPIYPSKQNILRAIQLTPLERVKVVILGQDPYHGEGQANGLCFSVEKGMKLPPSLRNIYKEISNELALKMNQSNGDLTPWAEQGVLLLNCILTVRKSEPLSHKDLGWEKLTNAMIQAVSDEAKPTVFLLWGQYAQSKRSLIDGHRHLILEAHHPSPLSAYRGFFGCNHFHQANQFLMDQGRRAIDWQIQ